MNSWGLRIVEALEVRFALKIRPGHSCWRDRARSCCHTFTRKIHAENRGHHRARTLIPNVAVIFDDCTVHGHVPVGDVYRADRLEVPELESALDVIGREDMAD